MTAPIEERWAVIPGFERYEVSDLGRVRAILTGHVIRTRASSYNGYAMIGMRAEGGQRTMRLHGIVAKAFVPNPGGKTQVDHIDGNRLNNAASNLEWVTPRENRARAVARGTSSAATNPNFRFKLSVDDIATIKRRITAGDRQCDIARDFGVNNSHISRINRGAAWKHSHLQAMPVSPADLREQCAQVAERYAKGCVTNHVCASIAAEIRALSIAISATAPLSENTDLGSK